MGLILFMTGITVFMMILAFFILRSENKEQAKTH
jgi:hypothetical protein